LSQQAIVRFSTLAFGADEDAATSMADLLDKGVACTALYARAYLVLNIPLSHDPFEAIELAVKDILPSF
jgi:hypothetical protein